MEMTMNDAPLLPLHRFLARYFTLKPSLLWANGLYLLGFGASIYVRSSTEAGVMSVLPIGLVTPQLVGAILIAGSLPYLFLKPSRVHLIVWIAYIPYWFASFLFLIEEGTSQAIMVHAFALYNLFVTALLVYKERVDV